MSSSTCAIWIVQQLTFAGSALKEVKHCLLVFHYVRRMDELPDELLLRILGYLDDGRALLDVVPLVCKRWHRVSREREAWASVVIRVELETCFEILLGYVDRPDEVPFDDSIAGDNRSKLLYRFTGDAFPHLTRFFCPRTADVLRRNELRVCTSIAYGNPTA